MQDIQNRFKYCAALVYSDLKDICRSKNHLLSEFSDVITCFNDNHSTTGWIPSCAHRKHYFYTSLFYRKFIPGQDCWHGSLCGAKYWLIFLLWLRGIVVTMSSSCRKTASSAILLVYSIDTLLCVEEYLWKWRLPLFFPSSDLVILSITTAWPIDWSIPTILIAFIIHPLK